MGGRGYLRLIGIGSVLIITGVSGAYGQSVSQQVQQNIDTLMQTNGCPGCNLQGADLNRMGLSGADLSGADLNMASFFLTDLSGANLSGANLRNAKFGGADLANADLRKADLRGAVLDGAYLKGSLMDGIQLDVNVEPAEVEAEITEKVYVPDQTEPKEIMDPQKVMVESDQIDDEDPKPQPVYPAQEAPPVKNITPMQQIDIDGEDQKKNDEEMTEKAEIEEPDLTLEQKIVDTEVPVQSELVQEAIEEKDVEVEKANVAADTSDMSDKVDAVDTVDTIGTADTEATIAGTAAVSAPIMDAETEMFIDKLLDDKRCYGCKLAGADLHGKNLRKADLERADLSGSNLEDVDFEMANLKGVSFKGANLRNADFRKADLYKADLSGADLTGADLKDAQLDETDFTGAIGYQPAVITQ